MCPQKHPIVIVVMSRDFVVVIVVVAVVAKVAVVVVVDGVIVVVVVDAVVVLVDWLAAVDVVEMHVVSDPFVHSPPAIEDLRVVVVLNSGSAAVGSQVVHLAL